jgi:hypothetical protein
MGSKARRLKKQRFEARAAEQRRQRQWIWIAVGVIVAVLLVGVIVWSIQKTNQPVPGQAMPIQGQEHLLPDEQIVHNLEHGHVIISYDCSKLDDCEAVKADLRQVVERFQRWKVVAVSRENADAAIALTAWGRIDKLETYDEDRIVTFVRHWRDRGPERTPE